jgi:hypothetical protein
MMRYSKTKRVSIDHILLSDMIASIYDVSDVGVVGTLSGVVGGLIGEVAVAAGVVGGAVGVGVAGGVALGGDVGCAALGVARGVRVGVRAGSLLGAALAGVLRDTGSMTGRNPVVGEVVVGTGPGRAGGLVRPGACPFAG